MNVLTGFARLAAFIVVGCVYFSMWRQSIPATMIVIFVHWYWPRQASRMATPYRSAPAEQTIGFSPTQIAASIGLLTTVFTVLAEQ